MRNTVREAVREAVLRARSHYAPLKVHQCAAEIAQSHSGSALVPLIEHALVREGARQGIGMEFAPGETAASVPQF
jgi:hypothetical protein